MPNPKPNTPKKKATKKTKPQKASCVGKLQEYYGIFYWNTSHMSEPVADAIAEDYWDWVCKQEDTAITGLRFAKLRGIPNDKWYDWQKKFPKLGYAVKEGKKYIGDNREVGMLNKRLSERAVLKSMPLYSEKWKELDQWLATLSKDDRTAFEKLVFEMRDLRTKDTDDKTE